MRTLLALFAFLVCAWPAAAQVAVRSDWVSLGDVAPVTGDAADILISPAPPAGQKLALDPAFVIGVAKKAGVIIALPLDQPILVTRAGGPPDAPQARLAPAAPKAPEAGATTALTGQVLVLVRDVARGAVLSAGDLEWRAQPGVAPRNLPRDPQLVAGMATKRNLRAGAVLYPTDFEEPHVIHKGEPVTLVYATGGLKLTVTGTAQGDAAKGEAVRVLNQYTKRSIDAVAVGEGEARISAR